MAESNLKAHIHLCVYEGGTWVWTQDFKLAKQAFYTWAIPPVYFSLVIVDTRSHELFAQDCNFQFNGIIVISPGRKIPSFGTKTQGWAWWLTPGILTISDVESWGLQFNARLGKSLGRSNFNQWHAFVFSCYMGRDRGSGWPGKKGRPYLKN
jgi:hypothetical protein